MRLVGILFLRENRVPASKCPWCGEVLDCATSLANQTPSPGSVSVCIKCAGISEFDENLMLVKVEEEELKTWNPEERLQVLTIRDAVMKKKPNPNAN